MLPVDVPAVLDALPEEDRIETVERYFFTCGLTVVYVPETCQVL